MNKTYLVEDLFEDIPDDPENVLFKIPPEICEEAGFYPGDIINIRLEDGKLILSKV